uniref:hypothetical protein n=1 Tax=Microbulbifer agarilyticus TaxID=260552 RepID=UPI000255B622|nr:hypothetical protein [Microbulbifer agarilyticus]
MTISHAVYIVITLPQHIGFPEGVIKENKQGLQGVMCRTFSGVLLWIVMGACAPGVEAITERKVNSPTQHWVWRTLDPLWSETQRNSGEGSVMLVLFPGYSVKREWAEQWASELLRQPVASAVDLAWIFAGPRSVFYQQRELPIVASIDRLRKDQSIRRVVLVAHSSGSFPAHQWLNLVADDKRLRARLSNAVTYINLDGGSGEGLEGDDLALGQSALELIARGRAVAAHDRVTGSRSSNHADMLATEARYPERIQYVALDVDSGCAEGAGWCLHDALIIQRPYNTHTFDLRRDYTDFTRDRPVNTGWWPAATDGR